MLQKDPAKRPQNIAETKERFDMMNQLEMLKLKMLADEVEAKQREEESSSVD